MLAAMQRSRILVVLAVLVLAALAAVSFLVAPSASGPPTIERQAARVIAVDRAPPSASPRDRDRPSASVVRDRRARDALRDEIVAALEHRGRDASGRGGVAARSADAVTPNAADDQPSGAIVDRIGGRERLITALDHDFMPLASECIDAARERRPELTGVVTLDLSLLSEHEHGAVVERAEPSVDNQVDDLELLECLRETALSLSLPPGSVDGLDAVMLTMPMTDE